MLWMALAGVVMVMIGIAVLIGLTMIGMAKGRAPHFSVERMMAATRDKRDT